MGGHRASPSTPCRGGSHRWWHSPAPGCGDDRSSVAVLVERPMRHRGEWWFAEQLADAASVALTERAKRLCQGCPQRWPCWDRAVAGREQHGVWGGSVFPGEYRALMRLRSKAAAGDLDAGPGPGAPGAVPEVRAS